MESGFRASVKSPSTPTTWSAPALLSGYAWPEVAIQGWPRPRVFRLRRSAPHADASREAGVRSSRLDPLLFRPRHSGRPRGDERQGCALRGRAARHRQNARPRFVDGLLPRPRREFDGTDERGEEVGAFGFRLWVLNLSSKFKGFVAEAGSQKPKAGSAIIAGGVFRDYYAGFRGRGGRSTDSYRKRRRIHGRSSRHRLGPRTPQRRYRSRSNEVYRHDHRLWPNYLVGRGISRYRLRRQAGRLRRSLARVIRKMPGRGGREEVIRQSVGGSSQFSVTQGM